MIPLNPSMTTQVKGGTTPSLSVLLCVNRTSQYLAEAVHSVLSQDDSDFEFLIAANACNDDLIEELRVLAGGDARVQIFRTAIGQLSFNLNYLADRATGDYLVRMDADDVSEPSRIGVLRAALKEWHPDVLGSWARFIDESGKHIGDFKLPTEPLDIVRKLPSGTVFCHPAVAIRKDFLLSMGGYLGGFVSEDTDLWIRSVRTGASLRNIPEYLLRYRIHNGQSIATRRGYAEVAAHWLREFLSNPAWYSARGLAISLAKCIFAVPVSRLRRARVRSGTQK
jgi:glycosyltransferase involved in cell wall biosynthesis